MGWRVPTMQIGGPGSSPARNHWYAAFEFQWSSCLFFSETCKYVDDRIILAPTETSCLLACQVWSRILGLTESESKEQFFHRKAADRKKFELAGFHPSKVRESPIILGTCLVGSKKRKRTPAATKRLRKACDTVNKWKICCCHSYSTSIFWMERKTSGDTGFVMFR